MNAIDLDDLWPHIQAARDLANASATGEPAYVWFSAGVIWRSASKAMVPANTDVIAVKPNGGGGG